MSLFKCCCSVTAIALFFSSTSALADTKVDKKTTKRLNTSSAGHITLTKKGEIDTPSGTAVTVDNNKNVTSSGKIAVGDADNAIGIRVKKGTNSKITNSGSIKVTEKFIAVDQDKDGIADGPLAKAKNRYGIYVEGGGTASGTIVNEGSIEVEGRNSGGIVVDSNYRGSLSNTGKVTVIGDNSYGIKTQAVSGDVTIRGTVNVVGQGSTAVSTKGDIGGVLKLQGVIRQSTAYKNDDGKTVKISRRKLRSGAAAVEVAGNVKGGIIVAVAPKDNDKKNDDEDKDGVKDTVEGNGNISSVGNGPALLIGGKKDTVIGTVKESPGAYSLVVEGIVSGDAKFSKTNAYGIVIGGQGGNVDLTGGINVTGTVKATTVDSTATAILINKGSTVKRISNSGTISATISSPGEGKVYAIRDLSGSLKTIQNTGHIIAKGSSEDVRQAIALANNSAGVTITQSLSKANSDAKKKKEKDGKKDTTVYTSIVGDIVTGSGNDRLAVSAGQIKGDSYFNAGDDTLALSGDAAYFGTVNFGTGKGTMTMTDESMFTGTLDAVGETVNLTLSGKAKYLGTVRNGSKLAVTVNGGIFGANSTATTAFNSLTIGKSGMLSAYIDGEKGKSSLFNVNTVKFTAGSKISATISSLKNAAGEYVILKSDSKITGAPKFDTSNIELPYIFAGSVTLKEKELVLKIRRKAAKELGLVRSSAEAYDAVISTSLNNSNFSGSVLEIKNKKNLQKHIDQMLPDHAGGIFDFATRGSRIAARHVMDASSIYNVSEVGAWLEPIFWKSGKNAADTTSFDTDGYGISTGLERWTKLGYVGFSYSYLNGKVKNNGGSGKIETSQHELGAHWRIESGPFYGFVRLSGAYVTLASSRAFAGSAQSKKYSAAATANWHGWLYSGTAGASYDFELGNRISLRPKVIIDYYQLRERGYAEKGKNDAFNLTVEKRKSDQISATTSLALAYRFGRKSKNHTPLTLELEGGRQHNIGGGLGATIANFKDGKKFTLSPRNIDPSWIGEARILTGGMDFTWQLSGRAEKRLDNIDYSVRASISLAL